MPLIWQTTKPDGSVAYVTLSPSRDAVERLKVWLVARSYEPSTHLGGSLLAICSPLISQQVLSAINQLSAHDYLGFIQTIAPVIVGIAGAVKAIITHEKGIPE
jgi:hypothetical protein